MDATKTKADRTVVLPPALLEEARSHVAQLTGDAARSDLLFPTDAGTLRTRNILAKPFKAIVAEMGIGATVTPRAMRRTFNDLARRVGLAAVLTRSISGHQTEEMQEHYSTTGDDEKRDALSRVHDIAAGKRPGGDPNAGV